MAKKNGYLRYKAYNFIDKDPIIDIIRTIKRDAHVSDAQIANMGGPTAGTLRNWFGGKTRRPQFATVAAAASAMGVESLPISAEQRKQFKSK